MKSRSNRSIYMFPLILGGILFYCGCKSTWVFRETPDHRTVAVLNDIDAAMPPYGEDWKLILEANAKNNINGKVNGESAIHQLYQTMDQDNAQLRNFLVASYAWYINTEMDTNEITRKDGRARWVETLNGVFSTTSSSRNLAAAHGGAILRMRNTLQGLFDKRPALEFGADPERTNWLSNLKMETELLESLERDLPESQQSDIAVIARSLLEYQNGDYGYAISRLPSLRIQMPLTFYMLAAAYTRN